ncbi:MAG: hypothetical protein IJ881_01495 [Neisseriaceae bacterium]|nr:hypothetical protein [Neisseriaceae bacterium]MBR3425842.1 hypothetical protein [Neisseriaceae bacterium]
MKKVIISAIIGAIFGGSVVAFGIGDNFSYQVSNTAQAKSLPKTVKNTSKIAENGELEKKFDPNEILGENIKFVFGNNLYSEDTDAQELENNKNEYTIFTIKKITWGYLDFELLHQNDDISEKTLKISGRATRNSNVDGIEHFGDITSDITGHYHNATAYGYEKDDCYFEIDYDSDYDKNTGKLTYGEIFIRGDTCPKLKNDNIHYLHSYFSFGE